MAVELIQTPISNADYNALKHINACHDSLLQYGPALRALLRTIHQHSLDQEVSVHLIHKHFDLEDNRIMVYETVTGVDHSDFLLSSPRKPEVCTNLRGFYFRAIGGQLAAYEYTTDAGADISHKKEFLQEFHDAIVKWGVQDVFALTVKIPTVTQLTEIELPLQKSTILLNNPAWLESEEGEISTPTDWIATDNVMNDDDVPGIIMLACKVTRTQTHHGLNCRATRNGHSSRPAYFEGLPGKNAEEDAILKHALVLIDPVV